MHVRFGYFSALHRRVTFPTNSLNHPFSCAVLLVRLINGKSNAEGRVEVLVDGVWRRVCAQNWELNDGHVVCRTMGYSHALNAGYYERFGRGKQSTSINNVQCKGDERNFTLCTHSGIRRQGCKNEQDAGVTCAGL